MSMLRRARYLGVSAGAFSIILGLFGGVSPPVYSILLPVGAIVIVTGFFALLGFVALAVSLLVIRSTR